MEFIKYKNNERWYVYNHSPVHKLYYYRVIIQIPVSLYSYVVIFFVYLIYVVVNITMNRVGTNLG